MMEKSFKKTKGLVYALAAMLVLICAMLLMTDTADAATKYYRVPVQSVDSTEPYKESPVGYVLSEYVLSDSGTKINYYYAKTADGERTKFATTKFEDQLSYGWKVITNGSKIYYSLERGGLSQNRKGKIYCGSTKGGTPKLLKTVSVKSGEQITLLGIYNGKLYFQIANESKTYVEKARLYSLNLKSKELKKVSANFDATFSHPSGNGRYLYGSSVGKDGLRVFDCKTNKIVRTIKEDDQVRADGGKLYYSTHNYEKNYTRIYCASLSGANRKLLLSLPWNTTVNYLGADVICYQVWVEGDNDGFHVYTPATGEDKVVDGTAESGYKWEMS